MGIPPARYFPAVLGSPRAGAPGPRPFGAYIHFPYCVAKCHYCDFASTTPPETGIAHRHYADLILREWYLAAPAYEPYALTSIYFGGGTPSLWDPAEIHRVVAGIRGGATATADPEITIEVNPGTIEGPAQLEAFARAGINRVSLGAQAFDDRRLGLLGRIHRAAEVPRAVAAARQAGIANLSLDLIFAALGQTVADVETDLHRALELEPSHVSVYGLTVEPGTPLHRMVARGEATVPSEEVYAAALERVRAVLEAAGFEAYEISNYARPGRRSRHNCLYWSGEAYAGLGLSAHGFLPDSPGARTGTRRANTRHLDKYLKWDGRALPPGHIERIGPREAALEALLTGLRWSGGVAHDTLAGLLPPAALTDFEARAALMVRRGQLTLHDGVYRTTPHAVLITDALIAELAQAVPSNPPGRRDGQR